METPHPTEEEEEEEVQAAGHFSSLTLLLLVERRTSSVFRQEGGKKKKDKKRNPDIPFNEMASPPLSRPIGRADRGAWSRSCDGWQPSHKVLRRRGRPDESNIITFMRK